VSTATRMVFGPVDLTHSEKFPLRQRHLNETNCWTLDLWILVGPVAGVTPLFPLRNLPRPQSCCRSGPPLRILLSQTSSDKLLRERSPALLSTLNTECLPRNEYSVGRTNTHLKQVVTQWTAIYFCSIRLDVLQAILFISTYQTTVEIITPSGVYQRGIPISAQVSGKM
jgi:hypothetical protein